MNRLELEAILPHRGPMLLLDEAWVEESLAHGKYTFRGDEWFFQGHFPGNPVTPGVILCEILAQSAAVLLDGAGTEHRVPYYTGLERVRFKSPVRPGDTLLTSCALRRSKPPFFFAKGEGYVGGKLCVTAEFSFALMGR